MDWFFSDDSIVILQQFTRAGITAATRTVLFGVVNEDLINANNPANHQEEQKRIALENNFA